MKTLKISLALIAVTFFLTLTGCKNEGCTDPFAVNYDMDAKEGGDCTYPQLSLVIKQKVGDANLVIGDTYSVGGYDMKFTLSQFYLSSFRIMDDDGNSYDVENEGEAIHILVKPDVSNYDLGPARAGHAHMLMFDVGVTEEVNAQSEIDFAAYPPDNPLSAQTPSMHWNWNSGYVFLKVEGAVDLNMNGTFDADENIVYHIGKDINRTTVSLMKHGDLTEANEQIELSFDPSMVFYGLDLTQEVNRSSHSQGEKQAVTDALTANLSKALTIGH